MGIHLSIDLDYWSHVEDKPITDKFGFFNKIKYNDYKDTQEFVHRLRSDSLKMIKKAVSLNKPIIVYSQHHSILKHVKDNYTKVINVDYHSDICEIRNGWPCCGSWANFFPGRAKMEFEWRYPSKVQCVKHGHGLCHLSHKDKAPEDPFLDDSNHTWKKVSRRHGVYGIPWKQVDDVSIILSINWSNPIPIKNTLELLIELERENKIKFYGKNVRRVINHFLDAANQGLDWVSSDVASRFARG